jgi:formylglycine-generating enzyme required for sulfatase activity
MTKPGSDDFSAITDEFFRRLDAGENPSIEEFAARYPAQAGKLRALLPMLIGMRADATADAVEAESADPVEPSRADEVASHGRPPSQPRGASASRVAAEDPPTADDVAAPARRRRPPVRLALVAFGTIVAVAAVCYAVFRPVPPYTDLSGMQFLRIPAGNFEMGAPEAEIKSLKLAPGNESRQAEFDSELPARTAAITKPFYFGMYEVTVREFREFVDDRKHVTDAERTGLGIGWDETRGVGETDKKYTWRNPGFQQTDDHPVVLVSWNDAQAFCEWKSLREKATYRLPTEAEWEYARRDGTPPYFDAERVEVYANVADTRLQQLYTTRKVEPLFDGHPFTAPVGSLKPNAHRLHDLTGNVYEWCSDWHSAGYQGATTFDPVGPAGGTLRAARGGSWNRTKVHLRVTSRVGAADPATGNFETGFRVVREIP